MGQCCHTGFLPRLIGAVAIKLQRVVVCQNAGCLLRFGSGLLFQLQVAGALLAGPVLLQLV
jgi:hypothetical protein